MNGIVDSSPSAPLFKCGCGISLPSAAEFKAHTLLDHTGEYVQGGSHYLCKFTEVILPALQSSKATKKTEKPKEKGNVTKKEKTNKRGRPKLSQDHQSSSKRAKSQPSLKQTQARPEQPSNLSPEESIFQLTRNPVCTVGPYYCGKCDISLSQANEFIAHCIQACQSLSNPASSHFIASRFDSQLQQSQCQLIQEQQRQSHFRDDGECDTIFLMFKELFDHRNEQFYCAACSKPIKMISYMKHINTAHSQMVPPGSSHIVLRMKRGSKDHLLYISPSVEWESKEAAYYCPCKPELKLEMQALVRHVTQVHRGISPLY